jgi:hypothetical protein
MVALCVGAVVLAAVRSARRRHAPIEKARRFQIAFGRAVERPEQVARAVPVWTKMLVAAGMAATATLTKIAMKRAFDGAPNA